MVSNKQYNIKANTMENIDLVSDDFYPKLQCRLFGVSNVELPAALSHSKYERLSLLFKFQASV